ncbi:MAG: hypothetical protein [Circular genetic element sp.]|nr:MAG: hypothetical protein [Circular genetic element sp.]
MRLDPRLLSWNLACSTWGAESPVMIQGAYGMGHIYGIPAAWSAAVMLIVWLPFCHTVRTRAKLIFVNLVTCVDKAEICLDCALLPVFLFIVLALRAFGLFHGGIYILL